MRRYACQWLLTTLFGGRRLSDSFNKNFVLKKIFSSVDSSFFQKTIAGITNNSLQVKKDFIFLAIKGNLNDGNDYIEDATVEDEVENGDVNEDNFDDNDEENEVINENNVNKTGEEYEENIEDLLSTIVKLYYYISN